MINVSMKFTVDTRLASNVNYSQSAGGAHGRINEILSYS